MDEIKYRRRGRINTAIEKSGESGSTYIEVIISIIILTVGLLGMLSAMTYAMLYAQEAEKQTRAKQIAGSIIENVFAIRDIQSQGGIPIIGWDAVQIKQNGNAGIFVGGWFPVREGPGADDIYGTTDDSCVVGGDCTFDAVVSGYERNIEISNLVENGVVRKRRVSVSIRYPASGGSLRQISISTLIANLPINEK